MQDKPIQRAKVTAKRQITIPKDIQERLGRLDEGDYILFYDEGDRIYIKKGIIKPANQ
ncbi:MAG: AbrB/MazE/SpoVT family DNA-binding domain-containing protein [Thaumarchaeota archaeon]|nr:AbrB/MazE/SpoVT family DNA-binding domain-containing protein [Nitrososphaerota archaeon]